MNSVVVPFGVVVVEVGFAIRRLRRRIITGMAL
jgi:hypothetical protein